MRFKNLFRKKSDRIGKCSMCGLCCHYKIQIGSVMYINLNSHCPFLAPPNELNQRKCLVYKKRLCLSEKDFLAMDYIMPESCTLVPKNYKHAGIIQDYLQLEKFLGVWPPPDQPECFREFPLLQRAAAILQKKKEVEDKLRI